MLLYDDFTCVITWFGLTYTTHTDRQTDRPCLTSIFSWCHSWFTHSLTLFLINSQDADAKAKMYMLTCQSLQVQLGGCILYIYIVWSSFFPLAFLIHSLIHLFIYSCLQPRGQRTRVKLCLRRGNWRYAWLRYKKTLKKSKSRRLRWGKTWLDSTRGCRRSFSVG